MEATKRILAVAVGPQRDALIQSKSDLSGMRPYIDGLIHGLGSRGRVIGTNYEIAYRERPKLDGKNAEDNGVFTAEASDVIFGMSTTVARAAHSATKSTPIVCVVSDLRAEGLSRAANVTGISGRRSQTAGDCFHHFLATVPTLKQVAVLHKPGYGPSERSLKLVKAAAAKRGVIVKALKAKTRQDLQQRLSGLSKRDLDTPPTLGVLVLAVDVFLGATKHIVDLVQGQKNIPTFFPVPDAVKSAGALGAYGVSQRNCGELMAEYTDQILWGNSTPKGLKVKDAPASMFEWVVSAEAIKALRIKGPKFI